MQAVRQLDALVDTEVELEFVQSAVLRRLTDDDSRVVKAVLSGAAIKLLSPAIFASEIQSLLGRCQAAYTSQAEGKSRRKAYRSVIRQASMTLPSCILVCLNNFKECVQS